MPPPHPPIIGCRARVPLPRAAAAVDDDGYDVGTVRYVGQVGTHASIFLGVAFDRPIGNTDGSYKVPFVLRLWHVF